MEGIAGRGHADIAHASWEEAWAALSQADAVGGLDGDRLNMLADACFFTGRLEYVAALPLAVEAFGTGKRTGDRDLETLALNVQGAILVRLGRVGDGVAMLDEAMTRAISGQLGVWAASYVYCTTIGTCQALGDYRRAAEWTSQIDRCSAQPSPAGFPGDCAVHRAAILRIRGSYADAEREALVSIDRQHDRSHAAEAMLEVGTIRLRLGDHAGAKDALNTAHQLGANPQPISALLYFAQSKQEEASAAIRTALDEETKDPLERVQLLPAAIEIFLGVGDEVGQALGCADDARQLSAVSAERVTGHRVKRTFMFTDVAGSTAMMAAMGDEAWAGLIAWHDRLFRCSPGTVARR